MKANYTHLILILDESGSMGVIWDSTIEGVNELIRQQRAVPGDFTTALYKFSWTVKGLERTTFSELNKVNYVPTGGTALNDAICKAIDDEGKYLASLKEDNRPDKVVVVVVTDGQENSSQLHSMEDVKTRVAQQESKYNWQFVFLGANIDAFATGGSYGFAQSGTLQWNQTHQGTIRAYACVTDTLTQYRAGAMNCMDVQATAAKTEEQQPTA